MKTTTAIFEKFTADYSSTIQFAVRADGQAFTRMQERHPRFGYRWTAWRTVSFVDTDRLRMRDDKGARLPKA